MRHGIVSYNAGMPTTTASARVRARLADELRARNITQRECAERLTAETGELWTQSRIGKVLNGAVELRVDDVEAIARVAGIFLSEAVRDRGLEFYAEMTPLELRVLERIRQKPTTLNALLVLLDLSPAITASQPSVSKQRKRGRPLDSEIAKKRG